jgi:hypothetical protein
MSSEDIIDIITQLRDLQIRQTELIQRLEQISGEPVAPTVQLVVPPVVHNIPRETRFIVGDRV